MKLLIFIIFVKVNQMRLIAFCNKDNKHVICHEGK